MNADDARTAPSDDRSRPDTSTQLMTVTQRIFNTAGSSREVNTPAVMFWAGDGHDHWHLGDRGLSVEPSGQWPPSRYRRQAWVLLLRQHPLPALAAPGAPSGSVYGGCGTAGDLRVTTGLSVGWGTSIRRDRLPVDRHHRAEVWPLPAARHARSGQLPGLGNPPTQALTPSPAAALAPRGVERPSARAAFSGNPSRPWPPHRVVCRLPPVGLLLG